MDGKGGCLDNVFTERLWRSLKQEEIYLKAYASIAEARAGIGAWINFYNDERLHQSLEYKTPVEIFNMNVLEIKQECYKAEINLSSLPEESYQQPSSAP